MHTYQANCCVSSYVLYCSSFVRLAVCIVYIDADCVVSVAPLLLAVGRTAWTRRFSSDRSSTLTPAVLRTTLRTEAARLLPARTRHSSRRPTAAIRSPCRRRCPYSSRITLLISSSSSRRHRSANHRSARHPRTVITCWIR